jgi:hypothetical protein
VPVFSGKQKKYSPSPNDRFMADAYGSTHSNFVTVISPPFPSPVTLAIFACSQSPDV